jgi:rhodanese-related sulfurtransferase
MNPMPATAKPEPLTEAALESHFRKMFPATGVSTVEELTGALEVGCIDGRRTRCVTAAPGGGPGLLILLLAGWEEVTASMLDEETIEKVFDRYLDRFGTFYMHSDRDTQARLGAAMGVDPDRVVFDPPLPLRPALLEAMVDPAHVGCGHLALLLGDPDAYGVRPALTRAVIQGFFRRLWDGDPRLTFDVLDGTHQEQAVAAIHTAPGAAADPDSVVAACPAHDRLQLFIHHPEAVAWLQRRQAEFLAEEGLVPRHAVEGILEAEGRLARLHLETTLRRLAPGLPTFDVWIELGHGSRPERVRVCRASDQERAELPVDLSPREFLQLQDPTDPNAIIVDVRTPGEFGEIHLAGARNVDVMDPGFLDRIHQLAIDPEQPLYLYCRTGNRSGHAARMLRENGYRQAVNVGGIAELAEEGAPTHS